MTNTKKKSAKSKVKLTKPNPLRAGHNLKNFDSGEEVLNLFLKQQALKAQTNNTAKTYVVCVGRQVVAYYSIAAGAVSHKQATSSLRGNTPDPIPCIILARLAVDKNYQNRQIGMHLLKDAMKRAVQAARVIGARTLVVHALNDDAAKFYKKYNFLPLRADEDGVTTLHITLSSIIDALNKAQ